MKNKSYNLPSKADEPILDMQRKKITIFDNKIGDGRDADFNLPEWLWTLIEEIKKDAYRIGQTDLQRELRDMLGC